MNERIKNYVDLLFSKIPASNKSIELKEEILTNMNDRMQDYLEEGKSEVEYSGFMYGEFLTPGELITVIGHAIEGAQIESGMKVTSVYIGVPGEFVSVVVKEYEEHFLQPRRVLYEDIEKLYIQGAKIKTNNEYELINRSPIYFTLSDGRMFINPIEQKSDGLYGKLSFCFASTYFTETVSNILKHYGVKKVEFISQNLYQGLFLTDEEERDRYVLLCDIGYITTNVMLVGGEGLLYLKSFSTGGGNITADIAERFQLPFEVAEKFKRIVSLSFKHEDEEMYEVEDKGEIYSLKAKEVNETAEYTLSDIAKMIKECIDMCPEDYPKYAPIYLTGGGVMYMRGAKEFLSRELSMSCQNVSQKNSQYDDPKMTSTYAVLDTALNDIKTKNSLFKNLFK